MHVTIPDDILTAAQMSESELKRELAVTLFQQDRLTLGQARRLADISYRNFQQLLAKRKIPMHYGVAEFEQDLATLRELGRL